MALRGSGHDSSPFMGARCAGDREGSEFALSSDGARPMVNAAMWAEATAIAAEYGVTAVENLFIRNFLPSAKGDQVKVYLWGLYQSARENAFETLEEAAEATAEPQAQPDAEADAAVGIPAEVRHGPARGGEISSPRRFAPPPSERGA